MNRIYTIRLTGNWCSGVYWEIVNRETGRVVKDYGPYHQSAGKKYAFDDAVDYANRNDLPLDSDVNFHVDPLAD